MNINPTNKPLDVELGGEKLRLWIDLNTYTAFEARSGQNFMEWIMDMTEVMSEQQIASATEIAELLRALGKEDARPDEKGKFADPEIQQKVERIIVKNGLRFVRGTSATKIHAFVWAAAHTYNNPGMDEHTPAWPYSYGAIGRLISHPREISTLMNRILAATVENTPTAKGAAKEAGESGRPTQSQSSTTETGGLGFGPSAEDALACLTPPLEG